VTGNLPSGSTSRPQGTVVSYSFVASPAFENVRVAIDGTAAPSSGTITLNEDHSVFVTADTLLRLSASDSSLVQAARSLVVGVDQLSALSLWEQRSAQAAQGLSPEEAARRRTLALVAAFDSLSETTQLADALVSLARALKSASAARVGQYRLETAPTAGIDFIYVNGIWTSPTEAESTQGKFIEPAVRSAGFLDASAFRVDRFYNTSWEYSPKNVFQYEACLAVAVAKFTLGLTSAAIRKTLSCVLLYGPLQDPLEAARQAFNILMDFPLAAQPDAKALATRVTQSLNRKRGVVLIAHSQGTLMVGEALNELGRSLTPAGIACVGVVAVAPPLKLPVPSGMRAVDDLLIEGARVRDALLSIDRFLSATATVRKRPNELSDQWDLVLTPFDPFELVISGRALHSVEGSYFGMFSSRTLLVKSIKDQADAVAASCNPPTEGPGTIGNGAVRLGQIAVGGLDEWTFDAAAGSAIVVSIGREPGTSTLWPWIRLFAPNGQLLGQANGRDAAQIATSFLDPIPAPSAGTYKVTVGSWDGSTGGFGGSGAYRLTAAVVPGALQVSSGDEGGPLLNGALHTGSIFPGDVDFWTLTATQGDAIVVSASRDARDPQLSPWIRLISPSGRVLGSAHDSLSTQIATSFRDPIVAPETGTYVVVVGTLDDTPMGFAGSGRYQLTTVKAPGSLTVSAGDEGGPLQTGTPTAGVITVGDVDAWTFSATQGQPLLLSVTRDVAVSQLWPWVRLISPTGRLIGQASGRDVVQIVDSFGQPIPAPLTGTYTAIVGSLDDKVSPFRGSGAYTILRR